MPFSLPSDMLHSANAVTVLITLIILGDPSVDVSIRVAAIFDTMDFNNSSEVSSDELVSSFKTFAFCHMTSCTGNTNVLLGSLNVNDSREEKYLSKRNCNL